MGGTSMLFSLLLAAQPSLVPTHNSDTRDITVFGCSIELPSDLEPRISGGSQGMDITLGPSISAGGAGSWITIRAHSDSDDHPTFGANYELKKIGGKEKDGLSINSFVSTQKFSKRKIHIDTITDGKITLTIFNGPDDYWQKISGGCRRN